MPTSPKGANPQIHSELRGQYWMSEWFPSEGRTGISDSLAIILFGLQLKITQVMSIFRQVLLYTDGTNTVLCKTGRTAGPLTHF